MVCQRHRAEQSGGEEVGRSSCTTVNLYCCPEREPRKTNTANLNTHQWVIECTVETVEMYAWALKVVKIHAVNFPAVCVRDFIIKH